MAFVGGQVDKTPTGDPLHAYDLTTQTQVVIRHIDTVLREFGSGLADVVKLVAFYANDGRVDEAAFLAEIGRHVLAYTGLSAGAGPAISLVPLPCLALPGMMVEIEAIAMWGSEGKALERLTANPSELAPLPSPFSHGVRCREHIWASAQRSQSVDGHIQHPGDILAQTDVAIARLSQVLEALGADLDDTVKLSTWYQGDGTRATWEPAARQRASYFAAFGLTLDDMVKQNSFYQGEADPATIVSNQRYRSSFYTEPAGASTGVPLPFLSLEALMMSVETVAITRT